MSARIPATLQPLGDQDVELRPDRATRQVFAARWVCRSSCLRRKRCETGREGDPPGHTNGIPSGYRAEAVRQAAVRLSEARAAFRKPTRWPKSSISDGRKGEAAKVANCDLPARPLALTRMKSESPTGLHVGLSVHSRQSQWTSGAFAICYFGHCYAHQISDDSAIGSVSEKAARASERRTAACLMDLLRDTLTGCHRCPGGLLSRPVSHRFRR